MLRHYVLSPEELALVRAKRTNATQLGFAILLLHLRHPGRVLGAGEVPPAPLVTFVARQLGVRQTAFAAYGRRDATRRQHLAELMRALDYRAFGRAGLQDLVDCLMPAARLDPRPGRLTIMALDELRRRRILLPAPAVVERAVHRARSQAERVNHDAVTAQLTSAHHQALDGLLLPRPDDKLTWFAWLRGAPQSPAARNILELIECVRVVRRLGLDRALRYAVPGPVFERLAEEGLRMTLQHLGELASGRRHAVLAAAAARLEETLTDATLGMVDKLMGSLARGAARRTEEKALRSLRDLHAHLRAFADAGQAVIEARNERRDPIAAIEQRMDWSRFVRHVSQAATISRPEATDSKTELLSKYATVRSFAPDLLETFTFQGSHSAASLLKAIETVRAAWVSSQRDLPEGAPTGFVRRSWRPFVIQSGVLNRRAYELCVLSELRDRLRAGDIWVEGSRHYRAFDTALIPRANFEQLKAEGPLPVAVAAGCADHLGDRRQVLHAELSAVATLAKFGTLPDVSLGGGDLKISPLRATTPPEAEALRDTAYDLLPRVRITDLLIEVDAWTGFSECFTHQRSGRVAEDRIALLAAILADGINLGLTRMADTCRGVTLRQLAWMHDWHIREDGYTAALARLIEAHRALPLARLWGDGTTSSSDGQYFRAGSQGESLGDINARHGNEPGVAFYTHISDQFGPFHTKVIAATASEAPHVLDGLLYHQTGIQVAEHYTDTGGATDHVFGLCALLGFRFAPRLRDINDRRLYLLPGMTADPMLEPLVGGIIDGEHVAAHWDEPLRLAVSIRAGTVTASAMLRRLAAYPRQNGLAVALREVGRLERSLFTLEWIRDGALRRRAQAGLNKGEARNALARALFFNRLGELRDRRFENLEASMRSRDTNAAQRLGATSLKPD